jgi:hypothetical protein
MVRETGLLEPALAEALRGASDKELAGWRDLPNEIDERLRTERGVVNKTMELYRANQGVIDAAVLGLTEYLDTPDGAAQLKALEGAYKAGEFELARSISGRMLESDELLPLQSQLKSAQLEAWGLGMSGGAFYYLGLGGGVENLNGTDLWDGRTWADLEGQFRSRFSVGMSASFWTSVPVKGIIFGAVVELTLRSVEINAKSLSGGVRLMVFGQWGFVARKFEFAGVLLQVGPTVTTPRVAGGIFAGVSWPYRPRRLSLDVKNAANDTGTITVNTSSTLAVTITANVDLSFDTGATMKLSMPYYFTSADVTAMTISSPPS